jgi:hypothetical protein
VDGNMLEQAELLACVTQARRIGDLTEPPDCCDEAAVIIKQATGEGPHHRRATRSQSNFAKLFAYWSQQCSTRAATAIANAGCETVADIKAVGASGFRAMPNTGRRTVAEIASLLPQGSWKTDYGRSTKVQARAPVTHRIENESGDVQLVTLQQQVVIDVHGKHPGVDGVERGGHGCVTLSRAEARYLRNALTLMLRQAGRAA